MGNADIAPQETLSRTVNGWQAQQFKSTVIKMMQRLTPLR